jgi:hypothetical protein
MAIRLLADLAGETNPDRRLALFQVGDKLTRALR